MFCAEGRADAEGLAVGAFEGDVIRMQPLKIAMIQSFLPSAAPHGGVGLQAHQIGNELIRRGNQVTMVSRDPRPGDALYEHRLLRTPDVFARPRLMRAAEGHLFPIRVALQDYSQFDVLHAHGDNAYLVDRGARPAVVRTFHGSAVDEALSALIGPTRVGLKEIYWAGQQLSYYPLEWLGGLNADVTVGISEATRKRLPFIEHIVGETVNVERFRRQPNSPTVSKDPVILFVGSLAGRKRGHMLVQAFKRDVLPKIPRAQLWMVCENEGEDGNVKYLGRRPNGQLPPLFHQAWVFCLPSSYEGFGIPYIEALSAGLPVVATPNPGAVEVLDHGDAGLLVEDAKLGSALVNLLVDDGLRQQLSQRGPSRAERFSLKNIVDQYQQLYALARDRKFSRSEAALAA